MQSLIYLITEILVMQTLKKFRGRVDSDTDNACYGLGPYVSLTEKLPFAYPVTIPRQCDDDQDGNYTFNAATLV
jgi:hypothetical protein